MVKEIAMATTMRQAALQRLVFTVAGSLLLACLWLLAPLPARAAILTVLNCNDTGAGSLRAAITTAASGDTIGFTAGLNCTITLGSTLTLSQNMTIDGTGATIAVDGNNAVRVFQVSGVTATLNALTIQHGNTDYGGGVYNQSGTLTVTNSTFSDNHATTNGGGIFNGGGTLTVTNSTFSGNRAGMGGGIFGSLSTTLTVTNSTFSGNRASDGGGIRVFGSTATLTNTIVANSPSGGDLIAAIGSFTGTNNLIDNAASAAGFVDGTNGNIVGHPALLAPLGAYGGPTQTFALLPGSPALDAGDNTTCQNTSGTASVNNRDQRGISRTGFGAHCDIGAFESRGFTLTPSGGNNQTTVVTAPFPSPLVATLSETGGAALPSVTVTFTAPGSGASATLTGNPATTNASGQVSVVAMANGTAGGYTVTASAQGLLTPATFSLTNALATPVVNNAGDGTASIANCAPGNANTCRLRDAIAAVNANAASGTTITFATDMTITLNQTAGTLPLTASMTIDGTNHRVVVDGGCTGCDPGGTPSGGVTVFTVNSGVTASLTNLTIQHGNSTAQCGVFTAKGGGGILNEGALTVTNSTIANNVAGDAGGGGIFACSGSLVVTDSTFIGNQSPTFLGGAIEGRSVVTGSTFINNVAVRGGAIAYTSGSGTTMTVTNSTFANNTASGNGGGEGGGGIWVGGGGTLIVTNSTISGNTANQGGGIFGNTNVSLALTNTIVAGNSGGEIFDLFPLVTDSHNVIGGNPLLGPLGTYGGPTQTLPLLPGSPAIDAGTTGAGVPTTDQRGKGRVGAPDIGAFESQGFSLTKQSGDAQSALVTTAFANPLVLSLTSGHNEPVAGGQVTFTIVPGTGGASATFGTLAGCTISNGNLTAVCPVSGTTATSPTLTANTTAGSFTVTVAATGAATQTFTLTSIAPTITLSPTSLPAAVKGIAYPSTTLSATGGTAPYTFTMTAGTLPPGLTLNPNGTLSGTPTTVGQSTFTVTATDAHGFVGTQPYTITITATPLVSIAVTPANGTLKVGQVQLYTATGSYQDGSTADITTQVTWTSDTMSIVSVDSTGKATGKSAGTAHLIVTQGSVSGQTGVTVTSGTAVGVAPAPAPASRPGAAAVTPPSGSPPTAPAPLPAPAGR